MDEYKKCSICLEKITQCATLGCGHCFHHECIKILFCIYMNDKCPLCKTTYTYKPSNHRKSRQNLRKKIIDKNANCCGRIDRQLIVDIRHYFIKHDVYIPFVEKMVDALYEFANDIINYIEYTKEWIYMYEKPRHYQDGLVIALSTKD